MKLKLKIWRQKDVRSKGEIKDYAVDNVSTHMSFLEMLDVLNEQLIEKGEDPVAFDHDCREGICGTCSMVINGIPHGNDHKGPHNYGTTVCQIHMRRFKDGDTIYIEPWRARPFPILKDLITDRSALDRIIQAGGFVSVGSGVTVDANSLPIGKKEADLAMDAAQCIGCGACVASCKNASAMLFVSAKVSQMALLPQGRVEATRRVQRMIAQMDKEGFGNCTNQYECQAACPKEVNVNFIARMNREYLSATLKDTEDVSGPIVKSEKPEYIKALSG